MLSNGCSVYWMRYSPQFWEALVLFQERLVVVKLSLVRHFPRWFPLTLYYCPFCCSCTYFFLFYCLDGLILTLPNVIFSTPIPKLWFMWAVVNEEMRWLRFSWTSPSWRWHCLMVVRSQSWREQHWWLTHQTCLSLLVKPPFIQVKPCCLDILPLVV